MEKQYAVYILTNKKNGTLYVGVTGDLLERVTQHRKKEKKGFTEKHNIYIDWYITSYMITLRMRFFGKSR